MQMVIDKFADVLAVELRSRTFDSGSESQVSSPKGPSCRTGMSAERETTSGLLHGSAENDQRGGDSAVLHSGGELKTPRSTTAARDDKAGRATPCSVHHSPTSTPRCKRAPRESAMETPGKVKTYSDSGTQRLAPCDYAYLRNAFVGLRYVSQSKSTGEIMIDSDDAWERVVAQEIGGVLPTLAVTIMLRPGLLEEKKLSQHEEGT